jgi:hypothetical protein
VLEVGEHEGRPRDPADLAGIDGEVLEGAPPSDEQAKPRSPRHRSDRRSVLRVRMLMSSSAPSASRTAANGSSLLRTRTELILITPLIALFASCNPPDSPARKWIVASTTHVLPRAPPCSPPPTPTELSSSGLYRPG